MKTILKAIVLLSCLVVTIWIGFFTGWSLDDMQAAYVTIPVCALIAVSFIVPLLDPLVGVVSFLLAMGLGLYGGLLVWMAFGVGDISPAVVLLLVAMSIGCGACLKLSKAAFRKN